MSQLKLLCLCLTHIFVHGEAALWLAAFVQSQRAKRHLVLRGVAGGVWRGTKAEINSLFIPGAPAGNISRCN